MKVLKAFFEPGAETVLTSPHPPQACAARLAAAIDNPMTMLGSKPAIGVASSFSAQIRQRHPYRNSFQQLLNVAITAEGDGARLSCRSSPPVLGQFFVIGWFGVAALVTLNMLASVAQGFLAPWFLIVPVLFALFGLGIAMLGQRVSNADEPFLLDFLRRTLDAR